MLLGRRALGARNGSVALNGGLGMVKDGHLLAEKWSVSTVLRGGKGLDTATNEWFDGQGIEMDALSIQASLAREFCIGGIPKGDLLVSLRNAGVRLNAAAEELFGSPLFETQAQRVSIQVVAFRVEQLGFGGGAVMPEILEAAQRMGLFPCPMETGPHLRLQFMDQAEGSIGQAARSGQAPAGSLTVVSIPLCDRVDFPKGFYLRRIEGELWLRGYRSDDLHVWSPGDRLVFAARQHM